MVNSCNLQSAEKFQKIFGKVSKGWWKQRVLSQCYKDVFIASNLFHLFEILKRASHSDG